MEKELKDNIEICDARSLASVVADEIVATVDEIVSEKGSCSLVLSGGSSPGAIYRTLSRPPRVTEIPWDSLRLYWGDERWVPKEDGQSNYRMVSETLLANLPTDSAPEVFGVDTSFDTCAQGASSYEEVIREKEGLDKNSIPEFDIVLLGMGEDGHFASIFPGDKQLSNRNEGGAAICCVGVNPGDKSERISLTVSAIMNARNIFFIIKGENKSETVRDVLQGNSSVIELPSTIFKEIPKKVRWFLDSAAAQHLSELT